MPDGAPAYARHLAAKGTRALQEGRYAEALESFSTLGTLKDVEKATYLSKVGTALAWRKQRELAKALEVLQGALGLGDDKFVLTYIGSTLHQLERYDEALAVFEKVKQNWPDDPDVWVYRVPPLIALGEIPEALGSAERAFRFRHRSSDQGKLLYFQAGGLAVLIGYKSMKKNGIAELEAAIGTFVKWRERARRDKQLPAFQQGVHSVKEILPPADLSVLKGFLRGVSLLSIRNPFDGWRALTKQIGRDWPKNVSAVEAIREQRRW